MHEGLDLDRFNFLCTIILHISGAYLISSLLASTAKCMQKTVLQQEDGRFCPFFALEQFSFLEDTKAHCSGSEKGTDGGRGREAAAAMAGCDFGYG